MRAKDFMMREEIMITANTTVYESIIALIEPRSGGLAVADDRNHWIDFVRDLDIGARQPVARTQDSQNIDRMPTLRGGMRAREAQ
jgi:hypothetical protein